MISYDMIAAKFDIILKLSNMKKISDIYLNKVWSTILYYIIWYDIIHDMINDKISVKIELILTKSGKWTRDLQESK